jgi:hypothetical protein
MPAERSLATCQNIDFHVEPDHGIPTLYGAFVYDDGGAQGIAVFIDVGFLMRFLAVFNVDRLQLVNGRRCWVTHTNSSILRFDPIEGSRGTPLIISEWSEWAQRRYAQISMDELRTGRTSTRRERPVPAMASPVAHTDVLDKVDDIFAELDPPAKPRKPRDLFEQLTEDE